MKKLWLSPVFMMALFLFAMMLSSCEKSDRSYSLLQAEKDFKAEAVVVPRKIDILWVVDNSNSMNSSQLKLESNFNSFIGRIQNLSYDFHMSVTSTDAWMGKYHDPEMTRMRDGKLINFTVVGSTVTANYEHNGYRIMDNSIPIADLPGIFIPIAKQGVAGTGDERAFESIKDVLSSSQNSSFHREGAYLAIIIVSDEDDFSSATKPTLAENYSSPNIVPVQTYKDYLDELAGSGSYSVNIISALDDQCVTDLNSTITGRRKGIRYSELADLTNGQKISICDASFATGLELISDKILEVASSYQLERDPVLGTISITRNGTSVPESSSDGWSYDSATRIISFHGSYVPNAGDQVNISYDPTTQTF